MKCLRCLEENKSSSLNCEKCGAPLPIRRWSDRNRGKIVFAAIAVILILVSGVAYLFRDIILPAADITGTMSPADKEQYQEESRTKREELKEKLRAVIKEQSVVPEKENKITANADAIPTEVPNVQKELIAGWVIITDPWGRQVNKFRSGLAGSGWLALPARLCLGGDKWFFYPDSGQAVEITGGQWIAGDKVGLWLISESAGTVEGPALAPWNDSEPVSWSSLESAAEYHPIQLGRSRADDPFILSSYPDYIDETGVFLQNGKVVGWSFGQWLPKGYMWRGRTGAEPAYKTLVKYFYNISFANGREEKFARALAMQKGFTGLDRLAAFIEGYRLQPKLALEDTPHYLMPEEIIKQMHILVTNAVNSGEVNKLADMFNGQVLKSIGDISLFMDVVQGIARARGFEAAVAEIEDTGRYITRKLGHEVPALNALHIKYYQDWLQSLVTAGSADEGLQVYGMARSQYPDDPYIHLLGAELTLLNGDWKEAERMLYMRNYPPAYQDRYELLGLRISEMKGQEDKIVIRFPRGSGTIPVTAYVNGSVRQNFLVDTGASMVTIPSSTADSLGLEVVHGKRIVSTAGGILKVREVMIHSIEIDGQVEYDVAAFVLDLPGRPGLGLLGLNYLGRFRMDLKPEEGTLMLAPR
ncbi:MAG: aspartyl protease family protein [Nitrospirae bacterium]|nr:aspartyl protease family protein [Nitrospirota bacterium]